MHHKISFCYTNVENDSTLAVTLIGGEHGEKLPEEPMCEAKMDPEAAGNDRVQAKSPPATPLPPGNGGGAGMLPLVKIKAPLTPLSQEDEMSSDDLISVGGSPSPSLTSPLNRAHQDDDGCEEDEYFRPLKKLRMAKVKSNFVAFLIAGFL